MDAKYPNRVGDRSAAEQLAYHGRRMQRFYDDDPCGTTRMYLRRGFGDRPREAVQPEMCYHDGKFAWISIREGHEERRGINVRSLLGGYILRKEPSVERYLQNVGLSSRLVAASSYIP